MSAYLSSSNVAAASLALVFAGIAALAGMRVRRLRWIALPAGLLVILGTGFWIWRETPRVTDVSAAPEYAHLFATPLCFNHEVFVTQWRSNLPVAEPAGFGGQNPMSVADYLAHPNDWHRSPAYIAHYGSLWVNREMPRVLTYANPGDRLRIVRVIDRYRPHRHDHFQEVHGEINGHMADVSLLLVGKGRVAPCETDAPALSVTAASPPSVTLR